MNSRHAGPVALCILGAGLLITAALAAGCDSGGRQGAGGSQTAATDRTAGDEPDKGNVPTVCTGCVTEERLGQTVAVEAEVVQQCPARGCWFRMKDDAGEVMVDLSPKKLELTGDRVGQRATVTGRVVKKGGRIWLEAEKVDFRSAETK